MHVVASVISCILFILCTKTIIINKFTLKMCFCVCTLMLYVLSYIKKVNKYYFHLLLDIQRHNMSC